MRRCANCRISWIRVERSWWARLSVLTCPAREQYASGTGDGSPSFLGRKRVVMSLKATKSKLYRHVGGLDDLAKQ
jgi:hypothetical protein